MLAPQAKPRQARAAPLAWLVRHQVGLSLLALLAWTGETAWRLPGDASYDMLNYHLYGPFALLHGKWGVDIVPAQSQGFLPPTNDLYYYLLARWIGDVRLLNLALMLPTAVARGLAFLLTLRLIGAATVTERLVALAATVVAATGAAAHPVLATTMSDMIPCSLVLGAVLLLVRGDSGGTGVVARHGLAGVLAGVALGLKLTFSYAAVALAAALLAVPGPALRRRLSHAALFCAGAGLAMLATGGWWWWFLWTSTGNPVFPLYNNVFHSPLTWAGDFVDRRYLPRGLLQSLAYPFRWAFDRTPLVTEPDEPMRDPRMALALLAGAVALMRSIGRPPDGAAGVRFAAAFFLIAFVLWEGQFSIFRYLSVLELLSGAMMAVAAFSVARSGRARQGVLGALVVLLAVLRVYTVYPNWGRQSVPGGEALPVQVRRLPEGSLVLFLDGAPLSYLALFEPDSVRFIGTNNNLTTPQQPGPAQERIRAAVAGQSSNLYSEENPGVGGVEVADRTLAAYGLRRSGCEPVMGAIVGTATWLCTLER